MNAVLPHVVIHTDGACSGNPGPGGWGAILTFGDHEKELKGGEANTTNNRMELMAAIAALEALKKPCRVDLHTDSQYLRNGIMTYIAKWKQQRLAHRRQEAGEEHRSMAAPRRGAQAASGALALGQRPRRPRHERARRRAGARSDRGNPCGGESHKLKLLPLKGGGQGGGPRRQRLRKR